MDILTIEKREVEGDKDATSRIRSHRGDPDSCIEGTSQGQVWRQGVVSCLTGINLQN